MRLLQPSPHTAQRLTKAMLDVYVQVIGTPIPRVAGLTLRDEPIGPEVVPFLVYLIEFQI